MIFHLVQSATKMQLVLIFVHQIQEPFKFAIKVHKKQSFKNGKAGFLLKKINKNYCLQSQYETECNIFIFSQMTKFGHTMA